MMQSTETCFHKDLLETSVYLLISPLNILPAPEKYLLTSNQMVLNVSPSKSPCLLNIRQHIYLCLSLCPTAVLPDTLIMTSSNENSKKNSGSKDLILWKKQLRVYLFA